MNAADFCPFILRYRTLQINPHQLLGMMQLADDSDIWARRNRYGRFRPPGWRSRREQLRSRPKTASAVQWPVRPPSSDFTAMPSWIVPQDQGMDHPRISTGSRSQDESPGPVPLLHTSRSSPDDLGITRLSDQEPPASSAPCQQPLSSHPDSHPSESLGVLQSPLPGPGDTLSSPKEAPAGSAVSTVYRHSASGGAIRSVSWREVWRYAVRSVLYDIRMRRHSTNAPRSVRRGAFFVSRHKLTSQRINPTLRCLMCI